MTPRLALYAVAAALALPLARGGGAAHACQPEHCPPPPLLCEWGPFAGSCVYPY